VSPSFTTTTQVSLDIAPNEIFTTRWLAAPPDKVWQAFTTRGQVERWWGPAGFTTTTTEMDVRPGGVWRHTMHGPDGRNWPNRVLYTRVEAPHRLEWAHDDDSGGEPLFHCSVTLQAQDGGTALTLRHTFASGAARDANLAVSGAVQGAIDTTNRLAHHLVS